MEVGDTDDLKPWGPGILIAGILELATLRSGMRPAVTSGEARNIATRLYNALTNGPKLRARSQQFGECPPCYLRRSIHDPRNTACRARLARRIS